MTEQKYIHKASMGSESSESSNNANNELFYDFIYNDVLMKQRTKVEADF